MEKDFFMKPKLRTKLRTKEKHFFASAEGNVTYTCTAVIQREFIWAEAMKLDDGQKPSTLIPLLNFQKNIKTY